MNLTQNAIINWKLFTTEREAPSKVGLGYNRQSVLIEREA